MDNQILQDLQLFGVDESVTQRELQMRWRHLSSHTHPDRFKRDTEEFAEALAKQKRLNSAKDRLSVFIAKRETEDRKRLSSMPSHDIDYSEKIAEQNAVPHIRTGEVNAEAKEVTIKVSRSVADELSSIAFFLGSMLAGATAASFLATVVPTLATAAPVVLIAAMLIIMSATLLGMKRWCDRIGQGEVHDAE